MGDELITTQNVTFDIFSIVTPAEILEYVAKHVGLTPGDITSRHRSPKLARARRVATLLLVGDGLTRLQTAHELTVGHNAIYRWLAEVGPRDEEEAAAVLTEMGQ